MTALPLAQDDGFFRDRAGGLVRRGQRHLPELGDRPLRPLRGPVLRAPRARRGVGGDRLRDLLRAGRRSPTAAAGSIGAGHPGRRGSSTRSPAWRRSSCSCRSPAAGRTTAIVALTAYTLLIFFRNFTAGLDGVPEEARDAGRGMGFTPRQLLWRVELPLALPAILAGLRIAVTTTVGPRRAGLLRRRPAASGEALASQKQFQTNVLLAGGLCVVMAVVLDLLVLAAQRVLTPWSRARAA